MTTPHVHSVGPSLTEASSASEAVPSTDTFMSMDEQDPTTNTLMPGPLDLHQDARSIVRLIQCSQCSYPYRTPVTLPCGNSLCRQCLPAAHNRENISYPVAPGRLTGITCPFTDCQRDHSLEDCSVDVVLLKVMEAIATEVARQRDISGDRKILLEEVMKFPEPVDDSDQALEDASRLEKAHSRTLNGGKLVATYTFAEMGELHYTSNVSYQVLNDLTDEVAITKDDDFVGLLKALTHDKVECQVCYNIMLEPITTPCGHSFCRNCVVRILDHSTLCPHCRRKLSLSPRMNTQPSNMTLSGVLNSLYAEELTARKEAFETEERASLDGLDVPLFICTVSFPQMPMILHVFEPRYRLMMRRALEGNRQFGMLPYNATGQPQGHLGRAQFMETGTMLRIEQCQALEDGRSFLVCRGLYRFKVQAHGTLDGYMVGRVQRHDDLSLAEEERLEVEQTTSLPVGEDDIIGQIEQMPTGELLAHCHAFVQRAHASSARWLSGHIRTIYGSPPNDPALFPFWFASVVPLSDEEKYKLLPTTSVRERLIITMKWIKKIESQRWPGSENEGQEGNDEDEEDDEDEDEDEEEELRIFLPIIE